MSGRIPGGPLPRPPREVSSMHNPQVPETLEGWCVLHQMWRVRWDRTRELSESTRRELCDEAVAALTAGTGAEAGRSIAAQMLGHKGDLLLVHFRRSFEAIAAVQLALARTRLAGILEAATSFVSIVELSMYEMTAKIHRDLAAAGLVAGTDAFERAFDEEMARQRDRVKNRLFVEIPSSRYVCFYPMNKRRGEQKNWYTVPFEKRAAMMREHGMVGRNYAGAVTQIISGAIGLDDWEWGVDLFADDPLVFKKLIYEMRFDEASAEYAEFGPFYVGLQFPIERIDDLLAGRLPR
jgi:peroxiredoxin